MNRWDERHLRNTARYARQIDGLYRTLAREAAAIGAGLHGFDPGRPFRFADYPQTKKRIDGLLDKLRSGVRAVVVNGIDAEWALANDKNSELARQALGGNIGKLGQARYRRYFGTNDGARRAFTARRTNGLALSDRVWKYAGQFRGEIEMGLDIGLRDGLPADEIARGLRKYLLEPDGLFRRVRDEHGQLHLSKNARAFHPGAGVYRSSQKNAERLARTETNMAYRAADHERWQRFDFVAGIEVRRSNNPFPCPLCAALAGRYPKAFRFTGWHPQCRCHAVPILKEPDDLFGKPGTKSANEVRDVPDGFRDWARENAERLAAAGARGALPPFLTENRRWWGGAL